MDFFKKKKRWGKGRENEKQIIISFGKSFPFGFSSLYVRPGQVCLFC